MLKKLIAYDFKCQWKMAIVLLGSSLVSAIISSLCFQGMYSIIDTVDDPTVLQLLLTIGMMLGFFFLLLLSMIAASAVILSVGIHYYKKFVSDEAYLTFTLPATPGQHLFAKLVSGNVWMILSSVIMIIDVMIIIVPMFLQQMNELYEAGFSYEEVYGTVDLVSPIASAISLVGTLLLSLAGIISQIALLYLSLTIGGILAQKHKAIAGVGIYIGADFIISGIISTITFVLDLGGVFASEMGAEIAVALIPYLNAAVFAAFSALFILLNKYLLTHKLNLA